jgi:hypothetical protein
MFKKRWFNVIVSDEGFSVKILGKVGLRYKEGSRTLLINSEIMAAGMQPDILIEKSSIQTWKKPHDDEVIDNSKREKILENVRRALEFYGWEIEIR